MEDPLTFRSAVKLSLLLSVPENTSKGLFSLLAPYVVSMDSISGNMVMYLTSSSLPQATNNITIIQFHGAFHKILISHIDCAGYMLC
jgi:hypothetical protein